jgi:RNA polymerase sigma-70 factor (ECF subfamily)
MVPGRTDVEQLPITSRDERGALNTMAGSILTSLLGCTDEQAMWRVRTRDDPEAFARLVARWQEPIRRLCVRMTGDEHRGEDLSQEAFTRVFARRKDWEPAAKFSTWLWRIAVNLCHDELRRRTRRGQQPLESEDGETEFAIADAAPDPSAHSLASERVGFVRDALHRLAEPYRAVVVLRHYEGLKFREIAEVLGIPEGTVKSRMTEALAQLTRWPRSSPWASRPSKPSCSCSGSRRGTPTSKTAAHGFPRRKVAGSVTR